MANWLIRSTKDWLQPIYEALKIKLLRQQVLHADETSVQVLKEDGKAAKSKSFMWLYRTSGEAENQIVIFEYQKSRHSEHVAEFLGNFSGFLHTDGYAGYHNLKKEITIVGCWAHARRKFFDIVKTTSQEDRAGSSAMRGVEFCDKLFALEKEFSNLSFEERYEVRNLKSKSILNEFFDWCKDLNVMPRSNLAKAVNYAISEQIRLENFLLDGRLEISNNRAENSIRPFVVGRKNWMFCNTPKGAQTSAIIYSIIETAKANGLNPYEYLTLVFKNAPNCDFCNNSDILERFFPFKSIFECFSL